MPNTEQFFNTLPVLKESVRLSASESQNMRAILASYADLHEVQTAVPTAYASPYSLHFFSRTFAAASLIVVLLIGSGVSVTYAAGNSLPGQPLYGVKVNIAEPIEGALIPSVAGKANWENVLAERRLTEASTLAVQNKLSSSTQVYLQQQVALHVAQSQEDSTELASTGQSDPALAVRSDLDARLSAHAQVLALLTQRLQQNGDSSSGQVAVLSQAVNTDESAVSLSRVASEVAVTNAATSTTPAARTATIAFVAAQNVARHKEQAQLFAQHAAILSLVPVHAATTTASTTTASTTITATSTITASSTLVHKVRLSLPHSN